VRIKSGWQTDQCVLRHK